MSARYSHALQCAKRVVIASGRPNTFRFVVNDPIEGICTMSGPVYELEGREDRCLAAVWSYEDGAYRGEEFVPNGKIAAAVEEYS